MTRSGGRQRKTSPASPPPSTRAGVERSEYRKGKPSRPSTSNAKSATPTSAVCGVRITVSASPHDSAVLAAAPPTTSRVTLETSVSAFAALAFAELTISSTRADMFASAPSSRIAVSYDTNCSRSVPTSASRFRVTSTRISAAASAETTNALPAPSAVATSASMGESAAHAPAGAWFTSSMVITSSAGAERAPCASIETYRSVSTPWKKGVGAYTKRASCTSAGFKGESAPSLGGANVSSGSSSSAGLT